MKFRKLFLNLQFLFRRRPKTVALGLVGNLTTRQRIAFSPPASRPVDRLACQVDFTHRRQEIFLDRQPAGRVCHIPNDVLGIPRQRCCDRRDVGVRVVGVTLAIAAEEKSGTLRCVLRQNHRVRRRNFGACRQDGQWLE